tara:strand:- start:78 stop:722 length:645 start_codon:yes stop_codon:yes gene_type:complete
MNNDSRIVLWGVGTSRTLRPIWVAEELGLTYEVNPIGPRTGETQTKEYSKLNPKLKVPFCEDGDFKLSESLAICRYLISVYGSNSTLMKPQSSEDSAKEDEWLSYIYGELDETSLYVVRRHQGLPDVYGEAPVAVDAARSYAMKHIEVIEAYLKGRTYLLAESFGLADIFLVTCLNWAESYGIPLPDGLTSYRDRIIQRDRYKTAIIKNQKSWS